MSDGIKPEIVANPWLRLIGRYRDDPTWEEFGLFLEEYRAEIDDIYRESTAGDEECLDEQGAI